MLLRTGQALIDEARPYAIAAATEDAAAATAAAIDAEIERRALAAGIGSQYHPAIAAPATRQPWQPAASDGLGLDHGLRVAAPITGQVIPHGLQPVGTGGRTTVSYAGLYPVTHPVAARAGGVRRADDTSIGEAVWREAQRRQMDGRAPLTPTELASLYLSPAPAPAVSVITDARPSRRLFRRRVA